MRMKKIPLPESQVQEVLFELINRMTIDRKTMMLYSDIWNLTARISNLRSMGVNIESVKLHSKNKYGREIEFVHYKCMDKKQATAIYLQLKANQ